MQGPHASPDTIRQYLRSELPGGESTRLMRHLLARCPECLLAAGQAAWVEPERPSSAFGRLLSRRVYERALRQAEGAALERESELERQRAVADAQWRELRRHPLRRQLWWVRNDPRFGTWGFCEKLLGESALLASREPAQAAELAGLALDALRRLEPGRYGAAPLGDLETSAWSALAEARRLDLDLEGADEALTRAREALARGSGDPLEEARMRRIEIALAGDQGDFERVGEDLRWVRRIALRAGDRTLEGGARILEAKAAGESDPQRGIALLGGVLEGVLGLVEGGDLWLELSARHHLIWFLNDAGRGRQAALLLAASRTLYRPFGCRRARLGRRWLEGRIARSLGYPAEAERAFEEIWPALSEPRLEFKLTCLSLDLAEVYLQRGKRQHVLPLVSGTLGAGVGDTEEDWPGKIGRSRTAGGVSMMVEARPVANGRSEPFNCRDRSVQG